MIVRIRATPPACPTPFTGRIVVFTGPPGGGEPRFGPNWFAPEPFFAIDVHRFTASDTVALGGVGMLAFPRERGLPPGPRVFQAVLDRSLEASVGTGVGNGISLPVTAMVTADVPIELTIDRVLPPRVFEANERVRELVVTSERLSRFHRRPVVMRAAVILPQSYASEPERHYPVLYQIPGFGGRHYGAAMAAQTPDPLAREGIAAIRVVLDPDCPLGHHVFADSANNGPWGAALTRELVPHLEKTYRAIARPEARLLTGHSSGGWSSLWLQITYPTFFGGVWSTSPDPVDFRDFQGIDLYRDRNFFRDDHGAERPLARRGERPVLFFQPFSEMERVLGHGGQLASFEAVFSPRMRDGQPRSLWNRDTGAIDSLTARTWEKYDIRLVLERHWRTLGPRLRGKLTVITGGLDTFYLEGAVIRLRESLHRLGSDAVVELVPGKDHGNLRDPELQARIAAQMAARLRGAGIGTTGSRGSLLLPTSR